MILRVCVCVCVFHEGYKMLNPQKTVAPIRKEVFYIQTQGAAAADCAWYVRHKMIVHYGTTRINNLKNVEY